LCLQLLSGLVAPPAYAAEGLALASVPGRFLLVPERGDDTAPLAGPLHWLFRQHDYELGRHNAQCLLARDLALPARHPAVADWTEAMDVAHGIWPKGIARRLPAPLRPILPLTGAARTVCVMPDWPRIEPKALRPIERKIRKRLFAVSAEL